MAYSKTTKGWRGDQRDLAFRLLARSMLTILKVMKQRSKTAVTVAVTLMFEFMLYTILILIEIVKQMN